jgi:hypothetical protein
LVFALAVSTANAGAVEAGVVPADSDAFNRSTAALLWPGATRSFLIDHGREFNNGEWVTRLSAAVDGSPAGDTKGIGFSADGMPIARWQMINRNVRWDFEAVALPALECPLI